MWIKRNIRVIALCAISICAGWLLSSSGKQDFRIGRNMEVLMNIFREINMFYVDSVNSDKLLSDAAHGMTSKLDPYTEYLSEEEMTGFETMTTGKYGGIGSAIRRQGDNIIIAQPYKGFPADKADLKIGDKLLEINGQTTKGMDVGDVSTILRGDPGTAVKIKVEKFGTGVVEEKTLRREKIYMSGVPFYGFIDDEIGYIKHDDFTEDCSNDMRKGLMEMKRSGKLKGLIIDLRGNGGGILQEAVKIVSMFVPKGAEVVAMRGRIKEMDEIFKTQTEPVDTELPIVVLVNSGTASASEIMSGAMQDLDRGVLMGQRTFGKGLVQTPRPVGYNAYLKLTTAKYYIPSGRCIQAIDYAHRNPDGSVSHVPDSLIREFSTGNGRKVYDGGGIMPDVKSEPEYISRFVYMVYNKGYVEDFVDMYFKKDLTRKIDLKTFRLSDADYQWFTRFMADKQVEFESETMLALKTLRESAVREQYIDKIEDQLTSVEKSIPNDEQGNLMLYRNDMVDIIESEIVQRQHYMQGAMEHSALKDRDVASAVKLLKDKATYNEIVKNKSTARK